MNASFSSQFGNTFVLGTLNFYNGTLAGTSVADAVTFNITLSLTTPVSVDDYSFKFNLINTDNSSDAKASADIVEFNSHISTSDFTHGGVVYTLELVGFVPVTGSGYVTSGQFHVPESESSSALLLGRITASSAAVPEPGTVALLGMGFLGLGWVASRRRKKFPAA